MSEAVFDLVRGEQPLLVSLPHCGIELPSGFEGRFTDRGQSLLDTDWHVDRLYDFVTDLGYSRIKARFSRYLIDLNRPPDDSSLYPGADGTGLCPLTTFDGDALYLRGQEPDANEVERRRKRFWQPYHAALQAELRRLRERHGAVLLLEAHSIRSVVPRLFDGRLPDLNLGSNSGKSCAAVLRDVAVDVLALSSYSCVLDARFKGGFITRAYGDPAAGIHALQLEIAQCCYLDESVGFAWQAEPAARLQITLCQLLQCLRARLEDLSCATC